MLHDHNFRTADDSASKVLNGLQFSIDNDDDDDDDDYLRNIFAQAHVSQLSTKEYLARN